MDNIRFVYFPMPVYIQAKNTLTAYRVLSSDTFELSIEDQWLKVVIDDKITMVPVYSISSIVLEA